MNGLEKKSIHDLRVIAQSFGVKDVFAKDRVALMAELQNKQQVIAPPPPPPIQPMVYDARLMTKPPSKAVTPEDAKVYLGAHIERGLRLTFTEEEWFMHYERKTDSGSMRMPLRIMLACADRIMR